MVGATAHHLARPLEQIAIEGEPITVTPRVALTLALGLHEPTTNASKYGALSVSAGRVEVRWRIERRRPQLSLLRIEWRERNGPTVEVLTRQGFGTRFIEGSVASELRGKATLDYDPSGLVCTMQIPLESITLDVETGTA